MTHVVVPRIDAYSDALPGWQQSICREVRDLVHAADPEINETIKRTNRPYFLLQGNGAALLAAKDHGNVLLYDGAIVHDPEGLLPAGRDNPTARPGATRRRQPPTADPRRADADHCRPLGLPDVNRRRSVRIGGAHDGTTGRPPDHRPPAFDRRELGWRKAGRVRGSRDGA